MEEEMMRNFLILVLLWDFWICPHGHIQNRSRIKRSSQSLSNHDILTFHPSERTFLHVFDEWWSPFERRGKIEISDITMGKFYPSSLPN